MTDAQAVGRLPAFAALDGYAVLTGQRRGASIQLDATYFEGQLRAIQHPETESMPTYRRQMLEDSLEICNNIQVQIDSITEQNLWDESKRLRRKLQRMPEVSYLSQGFQGRCVVVPEWLRTTNRLHYGSRVYLFREDDSPAATEILQENIDSVVNDSPEAFERYQGRLHGYPDCCIDFYQSRSPDQPSPEWRSVQPFARWICDDAFIQDCSSLNEVFAKPLDPKEIYSVFAREFFPEPRCEAAQAKGKAIYRALSSALPDSLVHDYFRLNLAYGYFVARTMRQGGDQRPPAGRLGREQLFFYLPVEDLLSSSTDDSAAREPWWS